jgi:hypothetical protein
LAGVFGVRPLPSQRKLGGRNVLNGMTGCGDDALLDFDRAGLLIEVGIQAVKQPVIAGLPIVVIGQFFSVQTAG